MAQAQDPRYRGHLVRIRLTALGCRYRADYRVDDGEWKPAEPSETRESAIGVAEHAAQAEIDRLRTAMPPGSQASR